MPLHSLRIALLNAKDIAEHNHIKGAAHEIQALIDKYCDGIETTDVVALGSGGTPPPPPPHPTKP